MIFIHVSGMIDKTVEEEIKRKDVPKRVRDGESRMVTVSQMDFEGRGEYSSQDVSMR